MHRQLETTPLLSKLLGDSISLEEVSEVLDRFLWAYRPIDRALEDALSQFLPTCRTPPPDATSDCRSCGPGTTEPKARAGDVFIPRNPA